MAITTNGQVVTVPVGEIKRGRKALFNDEAKKLITECYKFVGDVKKVVEIIQSDSVANTALRQHFKLSYMPDISSQTVRKCLPSDIETTKGRRSHEVVLQQAIKMNELLKELGITVADATAVDATAVDATAVDATAVDATAVDATAVDATAVDATAA
jgi:hypothetical protein